MTFLRKRTGQWAATLVLALLASVFTLTQLASEAARSEPRGPVLVVLNASWCATCREINPVVDRIASSSNLQVVKLDVDHGDAPGEASRYGVTISGGNVPQVYLFNNGKTVLLFNGASYHFGQSAQAEAQIRQRLDANL
jgi:thioredoxin-like negative regulator of GroEL